MGGSASSPPAWMKALAVSGLWLWYRNSSDRNGVAALTSAGWSSLEALAYGGGSGTHQRIGVGHRVEGMQWVGRLGCAHEQLGVQAHGGVVGHEQHLAHLLHTHL